MSEDEKKMCLDSHRSFLSSLFLFEDDAKIFDDDFTKDVMEKSQESRLEKGTKVSTPYGDGTISKYRPYNDTYDVELSFGHVFIGADSVKSENNNNTNKKSKKSSKKKSKKNHKKSNDQDKMDVDESNDKGLTTFIGDKSFYLYLRTYRCLYTAFANAKRLCAPRAVVPSTFIENRPVYESKDKHSVSKRGPNRSSEEDYERFLLLQCKVLRGEMEPHIFEKQCKKMMGSEGYTLICVDKIAREIVRHLFDLTVSNISKEFHELRKEASKDMEAYVAKAQEIADKEEYATDFVGLFALTYKSGKPVRKISEDKFVSIGHEFLKCCIPKQLPDTIGPQNGWIEPPTLEIRFQPAKCEDDYSLAAALKQMIHGGEDDGSQSDGGGNEEE